MSMKIRSLEERAVIKFPRKLKDSEVDLFLKRIAEGVGLRTQIIYETRFIKKAHPKRRRALLNISSEYVTEITNSDFGGRLDTTYGNSGNRNASNSVSKSFYLQRDEGTKDTSHNSLRFELSHEDLRGMNTYVLEMVRQARIASDTYFKENSRPI